MQLLDIHSHFLYGLDDGSPTIEAMYAMLDAANEEGIGRLYATPHAVPGCKPFLHEQYEKSFAEAQAYCAEKGYPIQLIKGAENLYTPTMETFARQNKLITMGDTNMVLVEFSPMISFNDIERALKMLDENGYQVIMAHIERYQCLQRPGAMEKVLQNYPNVLLQVNASSILGKHISFITSQCIRHWLKIQLIDFIASDAHRIPERPFMQKAAYEAMLQRCPEDYVNSVMTIE